MMKQFFILALVSLLFSNCSKSNAVSYVDKKDKAVFASVSLRKVEQNILALKNIDKVFVSKEEEIREKLTKQQNDIAKEYQDLESKKNTLDRTAIEKRAKDIEKKMIALQEKEKEYGRLFEAVKFQISMILNDYIKEATASIADESSYSIVFSEENLVFKNDVVQDVSVEVAAAVNKNHPKQIDVRGMFDEIEKNIEKQYKQQDSKKKSK